MTREELNTLFDPIQHAELECDGFSRIVSSMLIEAGCKPQLMAGTITVRGKVVRPHLWVELSGLIIDYQVRRWVGDHPWVPHGVFSSAETEAVYEGAEISASVIPAGIRAVMLMSFAELRSQAASAI